MLRDLFEQCNIEEVRIQYWGLSLIPIAILRKFVLLFVSKKKVIETGFKPPSSFINKLFNAMLAFENKIMNSPFLGTSVIAVGKIK